MPCTISDVYPTTAAGKWVAVFAMLTGVLVIAFPVSVFSDLWSKEVDRLRQLQGLDDTEQDDDDDDGDNSDNNISTVADAPLKPPGSHQRTQSDISSIYFSSRAQDVAALWSSINLGRLVGDHREEKNGDLNPDIEALNGNKPGTLSSKISCVTDASGTTANSNISANAICDSLGNVGDSSSIATGSSANAILSNGGSFLSVDNSNNKSGADVISMEKEDLAAIFQSLETIRESQARIETVLNKYKIQQ